jgi:hypothetical protein
MNKFNTKWIMCAVVLSAALLFGACSNGNSDDDTPVDTPTNTLTWHDIITVTKSTGTMTSYTGTDADNRVQVNVVVNNIPAALTDSYGTNLVMAGYYLTTSSGTSYNWDNNGSGDLDGSSLVSTVSGGSASFTFYWDTSLDTTDFKIFANNTWNTIIYDPKQSNYNTDIDFSDLAVKAGDVLTVTIDATNLVDLN